MAENNVKNEKNKGEEEARLTDHYVAATGALLHQAMAEVNGGREIKPSFDRKLSSNEEAVREALDEVRYDGPGKFSVR